MEETPLFLGPFRGNPSGCKSRNPLRGVHSQGTLCFSQKTKQTTKTKNTHTYKTPQNQTKTKEPTIKLT